MKDGKTFEEALRTREFEPDAPNFTPRISGMVDLSDDFSYKLSILKYNNGFCQRNFYEYEKATAGVGNLIHTYETDGNPIPTFKGEPKTVELNNDIDAFTNELWESLDKDNKVSLFVRYKDGREEVYHSYDVFVPGLPERDRELLREGIFVPSLSEALSLAEDYSS
jgi:hypothetical protein